MGVVNSATNIGRSGVQDWIIQRVSAYILALYTLFLLGFCVTTDVDYASWSGLFGQNWFRIFTLLALLAIAAHAWIGLWTVSTDYIKPALARFLFQALFILVIFVYVVWGIQILWGL